jgi:hypothetical protein
MAFPAYSLATLKALLTAFPTLLTTFPTKLHTPLQNPMMIAFLCDQSLNPSIRRPVSALEFSPSSAW